MLNSIAAREDVMFTVELGMRAYVCLSAENDPKPPPYIAGLSGYYAHVTGDEESLDLERWWISMWDTPPPNVTLEESLSMMVHAWQDMGASEETMVTWWNYWESRPIYDEAAEEAYRQYSWEEAVIEGRM